MLETFSYTNHMNETIEFGASSGIFVNENDLHDFSYKVTSKNDRISAMKKGVVKKTIPLIIKCKTEAEGIAARNRLYEVMDKDTLAMKHGKLICNGYYLKCFCSGSKKSNYLLTKEYMVVKLTIQTDFPEWVKETTTTFNYGAGAQGTNLDFNNDFPYDYASNLLGKKMNNTGFIPSNFRMVIYGAIENPKITVSGHDYEVSVSVGANEFLTIDSIDKTIILTHTDGSKENCFHLRNRESYIFEKIPTGENDVSVNGDFKFDVTLLEERGEPKWI